MEDMLPDSFSTLPSYGRRCISSSQIRGGIATLQRRAWAGKNVRQAKSPQLGRSLCRLIAARSYRVARSSVVAVVGVGLLALGLAGCADHVAGQVELLTFDAKGNLQRYSRADDPTRINTIPGVNEPIRSNDDVITIQVESAYIQNLPFRLTGSKDVIIFADVWENAAMGFNGPSSLTSIVYVGPNQKVPGRLNFRDMLAYGPTKDVTDGRSLADTNLRLVERTE